MHPRTRQKSEEIARHRASQLARERAQAVATRLAWSATLTEVELGWELRAGDGCTLKMDTFPDYHRISPLPTLCPTRLLHFAGLCWDATTWLPPGASVRPPRHHYFEWRDGLPGEAPDWRWQDGAYVFEGLGAQLIPRVKRALKEAPSQTQTVVISHDSMKVNLRGDLDDLDHLVACVKDWKRYLSTCWIKLSMPDTAWEDK